MSWHGLMWSRLRRYVAHAFDYSPEALRANVHCPPHPFSLQQTNEVVKKQTQEEEKIKKIEEKLQAAQKELEEATAKREEADAAQADDDAGEALLNEMEQIKAKIKDIMAQMSEAKVSDFMKYYVLNRILTHRPLSRFADRTARYAGANQDAPGTDSCTRQGARGSL